MLKINNVDMLLTDIVLKIKADPDLKWNKYFPYYLVKMNGAGLTYVDFDAVMEALNKYVENEPKNDQRALERHRSPTSLTDNCALIKPTVTTGQILQADRAAMLQLVAGGTHAGLTDKGAHNSDPETGKQKSPKVSVREFYINGPAGRRATKRSENGVVTYYYSSNHAANTYTYQRVV